MQWHMVQREKVSHEGVRACLDSERMLLHIIGFMGPSWLYSTYRDIPPPLHNRLSHEAMALGERERVGLVFIEKGVIYSREKHG